MVKFFQELCQPHTMQFEPLSVCGRCVENQETSISSQDFVDSFIEAYEQAAEYGITLACAGVRIYRRTEYYCGAAGFTLCVTSKGSFTTCHRVDNESDPLANQFIYGGWNGENYVVNNDQLSRLQSQLNVNNISECDQCFCRSTCGGGCYASRHAETGSLTGSFMDNRCIIIRELTRHTLIKLAQSRNLIEQVQKRG